MYRKRILMRHLLITLILLLSFTGCQDKEHEAEQQAKHDAKIAQQARAELLAEIEAEKAQMKKAQVEKDAQVQEDTKLTKMGITMDDGTVTIDTNKTKDFFSELTKKMDAQIKKMGDDLEKGILQTKEAGIDINEKHIHIDLNKTQDLLEEWGKKIQVFVEEFDEMAKTLETNNSNTTNKGI